MIGWGLGIAYQRIQQLGAHGVVHGGGSGVDLLLDDEGRQLLLPLLERGFRGAVLLVRVLVARERSRVVQLVDYGPDGTQGAGLGMHGSEGMREVPGRGIAGCCIAELPPCGLKGNPLSRVGALCHASVSAIPRAAPRRTVNCDLSSRGREAADLMRQYTATDLTVAD